MQLPITLGDFYNEPFNAYIGEQGFCFLYTEADARTDRQYSISTRFRLCLKPKVTIRFISTPYGYCPWTDVWLIQRHYGDAGLCQVCFSPLARHTAHWILLPVGGGGQRFPPLL